MFLQQASYTPSFGGLGFSRMSSVIGNHLQRRFPETPFIRSLLKKEMSETGGTSVPAAHSMEAV